MCLAFSASLVSPTEALDFAANANRSKYKYVSDNKISDITTCIFVAQQICLGLL